MLACESWGAISLSFASVASPAAGSRNTPATS